MSIVGVTGLGLCCPTELSSVGGKLAMAWGKRVSSNGGARPTGSTLRAVVHTLNKLTSAGLLSLDPAQSKIKRMNLFAGSDLISALTPQVVGGGLVLEANNGFVEGDYQERGASGGITGDGASTFDMGWTPATSLASSLNAHIAVYVMAAGATFRGYLGSVDSGDTGLRFWIDNDGTNTRYFCGPSGEITIQVTPVATGFVIGTNRAANDAELYDDGSSIGTDTAFTTDDLPDQSCYGFQSNGFGSVSTARLGGYSLGAGLTDQEASDYTTIIEEFQDALGRGVA